ncbi:NAC domain-containing protein 41-like [Carex rostrata]
MVAIPYLIIAGRRFPLPIGFRFVPSDEEIVLLYLSKKVQSLPMLPLPESLVMPEIQIAQFDPWNLPGDDDEDMKFFYTREEPEIMQRGMRVKRVSIAGVWREREEEPILSPDARDVIAMKRTYTFERTRGQRTANRPRATWTMYEYRLVRTDTLNQHLSRIADANGVALQFTRYYACKIVRRMMSGGGGGVVEAAEPSNAESSASC